MNCHSLKELSKLIPNQKVLVFDTNRDFAQSLAELIAQESYQITVENQIDSFTKANIDQFDIIVFGWSDSSDIQVLLRQLEKKSLHCFVLGKVENFHTKNQLIKSGVVEFINTDQNLQKIYKNIVTSLITLARNSQFTIFVIESDLDRQKEMETILKNLNFQTLLAKDLLEFFTQFEHHGDMVILSSEIADIKYLSVVETILTDSKKKHIPILVTSQRHNPNTYIDTLSHGGKDYFSFSDSYEILISKVKIWIENVRQHYENECSKKFLEEYREAVDISAIVSKATTTGIITYANDAFCKITGYSKEELIGKQHNIIRHPDTPKSAFEDLWKTIKNKKPWHGVLKNRRKDGSHYWTNSTIKPIVDEYGNIVEFIGIRNDITEIQDIKENLSHELNIKESNLGKALKLSQEYERAINESNILSRTDLQGNIIYVNDEFCNVSGYGRDELIGNTHRVVKHSDNPISLFKDLWRTITSGEVWKGQLKNRAKDGSTYYVNSVIFPITDENGKTIEYMAIRHNVTEIITLHKEIEDTQREVIHTMGEIGESRSKETGYHVKRVSEYSKLLGRLYGLEKKQVETLGNASPMHDIGKVAIPDAILNKPGRFNEEEYEYMKKHSEIGYSVLKNSNRQLLQAAAIISHQHHEKWDGTGYPRGLKGEEIHIYGRITAIADVFDALGSDRVYKKAWDDERILNLFREEKGKHFEPMLVNKFFENLDLFWEIRDRYKENS